MEPRKRRQFFAHAYLIVLCRCVGVYAYIRTPIPPHVLLQLIRVLNTHNVINQYDRLTGPLR